MRIHSPAPPPLPPGLPPRTTGFLGAYQDYWRRSMLWLASFADSEATLFAELNRHLPATAPDLDRATDVVRETVEAEGLHALTGMTLPYYEFMLWRTHTPTTYAVALPEQQVDVTVIFLDDFVSLGWAGFATCGRSHTGGWATATALYAVHSGYDLDSEQFRVSCLAHEGQHFADYRRFPKLAQPELEYRAKSTSTPPRMRCSSTVRARSKRSAPRRSSNTCAENGASVAVRSGTTRASRATPSSAPCRCCSSATTAGTRMPSAA